MRLFFLYSYQVLIRVKVVICIWADTICHYHALAKDISYYKWYVRTFFFETATYIKNVITKMGFIRKKFGIITQFISKVVDLGSDTFSNPSFQKELTKLAILLDYKRSGLLCLALLPRQKIGPDFSKKSGFKIEVTKKLF